MIAQADIELLEQYVDGTLADGDIERLRMLLRKSAEARALLRTLAAVDFGLQDIAASGHATAADDEHRTSLREADDLPAKRSWPLDIRALLAVAAVVTVALATSLFVQRVSHDRNLANVAANSSRPIAKITGVGGVVVWTGDGGRVTSDLTVGTELTGGTMEGTSPDSWVALRFHDGSKVTISGDTRLTFSDFGQKVLHLKKGDVASQVNQQPANKPMLIHTRTAQLEVLGTEFNAATDVASTAVNVNEGKVRVTRLSDGHTVDVPANHRVVTADELALLPEVIPESVDRWKSQLHLGPAGTHGQWFPQTTAGDAKLKAVPYPFTTEEQTVTVYAAGLQVSQSDKSSVVLLADSRIRVRGRVESACDLYFGVTVRDAAGGFAGNFFVTRPASEFEGRDEFEIVFEVGELELAPDLVHVKEELARSPADGVIEVFYCSSAADPVVLEILEVQMGDLETDAR